MSGVNLNNNEDNLIDDEVVQADPVVTLLVDEEPANHSPQNKATMVPENEVPSDGILVDDANYTESDNCATSSDYESRCKERDMRRAKIRKHVRKRKKRDNPFADMDSDQLKKGIFVGVLLIVFAFIVIPQLMPGKRDVQTAENIVAETITYEAPKFVSWHISGPLDSEIRNPMLILKQDELNTTKNSGNNEPVAQDPAAVKALLLEDLKAHFYATGFFYNYSTKVPTVIINENVYKQGDIINDLQLSKKHCDQSYDGVTLVEVQRDYVTFTKDDIRWTQRKK